MSVHLLNEREILQIQRKINSTGKIKMDSKGRILVPKEEYFRIIVGVHVKNKHDTLEADFNSLKQFHFLGHRSGKIKRFMQC